MAKVSKKESEATEKANNAETVEKEVKTTKKVGAPRKAGSAKAKATSKSKSKAAAEDIDDGLPKKSPQEISALKVAAVKKATDKAVPVVKEKIVEQEITPSKGNPRYSDEDLEEFRVIISQSREETLDELRLLKEKLDDLTNSEAATETMIYSMHMAEQGSEMQEQEKTVAQIQRANEYLKKLDEALQRINDKTYGICRVCNILIAKERLLAVPVTTLSASYKIHMRCPVDGIDRIEAIKN